MFSHDSVLRRQQLFGYTHEELKVIIAPTALKGTEPLGSMGTDTPIAVLSTRPRLLFDYFAQLFAQVTNPPLDAIREEVVTSVSSTIGPEAEPAAPGPGELPPARAAVPDHRQRRAGQDRPRQRRRAASPVCARTSSRASTASPVAGWRSSGRWRAICGEVSAAIDDGARVIVLSDRNADEVEAPIPSLLLTAAVHHHLVRTKQRTMVGLLVECGDAREVHHMALLIGYGAGAINPYLAFESIEDLIAERMHGLGEIDPAKAMRNYIKACGKGVLKVMSKMGVSTVASYTGAQIFEAIGLGEELVEQYFTGTVSRLGGIGLGRDRHRGRRPPRPGPPDPSRGAGPPQARARRRVPVAPRGRGPPVQPGDRVQAAARHAGQALRHLPPVLPARRRPVAAAGHAARPVRAPRGQRPRRSRSTRSSRRRRSCGASPPGR